MTNEERNRKRRERYAAKKKAEAEEARGGYALANARRLDAFFSQTVGAGVSGVDKFTSYTFREEQELDEETLEALFVHNDLAATIVERKPRDAMREGYTLDWQGATDQQIRDVIDWAEGLYNVTQEVLQTAIHSRLFGGAGLLLGIDGDPEKPPIEGRDVEFIRSISARWLEGWAWYNNPTDQDYGKVATYRWTLRTFSPSDEMKAGPRAKKKKDFPTVLVDEHRIIPMYGILTTEDEFYDDRGWGKSVLQRVYEVLKKFEASYDAVLHALAENSIGVYKVEGLLKMLQSKNADLLRARFQLLNAGKSNYNSIVLGETESFERVEARLSEAANVVQAAMQRVSAAANMPSTILWGMQPAGQNATGESDMENWHQQVAQYQTLELAPVIRNVYRWLLGQIDSPLRGRVPDDLKVEFPPLWTPSLQDMVNMYVQVAGADTAYVNAKVLLPEQVAVKRAQETGLFPKVDLDLLEETLELRKERLLNPPDPMAMMQPSEEGEDDNTQQPPNGDAGNQENEEPDDESSAGPD